MNRFQTISFFLFFGASAPLAAADGGVSKYAYTLTEIGGVPITNSMVTTWVVAIVSIVVIRLVVGRPEMIPAKGQAVIESIYSGIQTTIQPIVGAKMVSKTFPFLLCLFLFIFINNYSGLLPGVGAFGHYDAEGNLTYYFRPGTSDLNTTVALASIAMAGWLFFVLRYAGAKTLAFDLFGNKADKKTTPIYLYLFLSLIFLLVGFIEVISIAIRPVTLSMRLYGNILGGETLLATMLEKTAWYIPVAFPFYFLEMLVGLIQAFVFTLLVAVYIGLICNHDEAEH